MIGDPYILFDTLVFYTNFLLIKICRGRFLRERILKCHYFLMLLLRLGDQTIIIMVLSLCVTCGTFEHLLNKRVVPPVPSSFNRIKNCPFWRNSRDPLVRYRTFTIQHQFSIFATSRNRLKLKHNTSVLCIFFSLPILSDVFTVGPLRPILHILHILSPNLVHSLRLLSRFQIKSNQIRFQILTS